MKCLSVRQPRSDLICPTRDMIDALMGVAVLPNGATLPKDVENRTFGTKYRGRLYVHASKKLDKGGPKIDTEHVFGAIIGHVDVVDCSKEQASPWHEYARVGWYVKSPIRLETPVPWIGRQGLFNIDQEEFEIAQFKTLKEKDGTMGTEKVELVEVDMKEDVVVDGIVPGDEVQESGLTAEQETKIDETVAAGEVAENAEHVKQTTIYAFMVNGTTCVLVSSTGSRLAEIEAENEAVAKEEIGYGFDPADEARAVMDTLDEKYPGGWTYEWVKDPGGHAELIEALKKAEGSSSDVGEPEDTITEYKPKQELEKVCTRSVTVEMTPSELQLRSLIRKVQELKAERLMTQQQMNADVKAAEKCMFEALNNKCTRDVECDVVYDWEVGTKKYISREDSVVLEVINITDTERQVELDLQNPTEPENPFDGGDDEGQDTDAIDESATGDVDEGGSTGTTDEDTETTEQISGGTELGEDGEKPTDGMFD